MLGNGSTSEKGRRGSRENNDGRIRDPRVDNVRSGDKRSDVPIDNFFPTQKYPVKNILGQSGNKIYHQCQKLHNDRKFYA